MAPVRVKKLPAPFSRYAVSRCGKYVLSRARRNRWRKLKLFPHKHGYVVANLQYDPGSKRNRTTISVHILVMLAWVGPCPEGKEVCHYPDGNKTNNSLDNLIYGTKKDNQSHRYSQGCQGMGETHPGSRLTEEKVRQARREYKPWGQSGGKTLQQLADEFGVGLEPLRRAVYGITWKCVV